jgi:integrase
VVTTLEYCRSFIDRKSYDYAASTVVTYGTYANHLGTALGGMPISDIKPLHNDIVIKYLRSVKLSDAKIQLIMTFYFQVLTDAHENGEMIMAPKRSKKLKAAPAAAIKEHLDSETIDRVIEHIEPFYQPIFKFIASTGVRPCEALALKWTDIANNQITIARGRVRGNEGKTKTKLTRMLHVTPVISRLLNNLPRESEYVFSRGGEPLSFNLDRIWRRAAQPLGITQVAYNLRHSYASNLIARGATLPAVSKLIGHSNVRTTARYYVGTSAADNTSALLDEIYQ